VLNTSCCIVSHLASRRLKTASRCRTSHPTSPPGLHHTADLHEVQTYGRVHTRPRIYTYKDLKLRQPTADSCQLSWMPHFKLRQPHSRATTLADTSNGCWQLFEMLGGLRKSRTGQMCICNHFRSVCLTADDSRAYVLGLPCSRAYAVHVRTRMQCGATLGSDPRYS
jgi:hypothetical protein